jgi:hypothetical protein
MFRAAMKTESDTHNMAIRYTLNKIHTREFQARQVKQSGKTCEEKDYHCPMCRMKTNTQSTQTKEHIWKGECCHTKEIWIQMATDLRTEMKKWGVKEGAESKIRQAIETEWQMADTQHKDGELEAHGNGMGLIGIWTNKTLQRIIKILTEDMKWSEEVSMEKAKDLAFINMDGATKIDKKISNMKQSMYDQVQPIEKELWKFAKGKANNWMDIKITETELKFTDTIKQRMQWNGNMIMDYMVKQMEGKIMQGKEEKKEIQCCRTGLKRKN